MRIPPAWRRALLLFTLGAGSCARARTTPAAAPSTRLQLVLLAGQSNMAGRGTVDAQDRVIHSRVFMLDRALHWVPAIDPVHFDKSVAGVGPGRTFGIVVADANPDVRVGLIPAAVGGSPISSWEPGALDGATKTHPYDDAMLRAREAMKSGDLKAILWHQGESDAKPEQSKVYDRKLRALIERFRRELGDPELPFIIGQLGQFEARPWDANTVRVDSVHRAVAATMHNVAYVSAEGLQDRGDTLHFSSAAAREFGRRYANAYFSLTRK